MRISDLGLWFAIGWLSLVGLAAGLAPLLPLDDPLSIDLLNQVATPSAGHLLGTDGLGRDVLSRLVYGARVSLFVGITAPAIGVLVGGWAGLIAGYFGGPIDRAVAFVVDTLLAFPALVLALVLTVYLGQSVINVTIALGVLSVPGFARVCRANTLAWAHQEFVDAATAMGFGTPRILLRHIAPNVLPALAAYCFVVVAFMITAEGALSFLGLGVPAPTPSWGSMIAEGSEFLAEYPFLSLLPASAMFLTVFSFNLVAESAGRRPARNAINTE